MKIRTTSLQKIHKILFYLLILFLPTQLGFHWWPAWTYILGRRIDYLSPTLYVTDILIVLMLGSWAWEKVKSSKYKVVREKFALLPLSAFSLPLATILFVSLNIYISVSRPVAIYGWIKLLEFVLLGAYVIETKPAFSELIPWFSGAVLYSSCIALGQFLSQHSLGSVFWFLGERTFSSMTPGIAQIALCLPFRFTCPLLLRGYGTFPHPNVLGGFLAVTLPWIFIVIASKAKQSDERLPRLLRSLAMTERYVEYLAFGFGVLALIITFSRSAWFVTLFVVGYLLLQLARKKYTGFIGAALFIICLGIFIVFPFSGDSESVVVREQLNSVALSITQTSPWIGRGLNNFLVLLPHYLINHETYVLQPVHNIYLLVLSEAGIIGLFIFLMMVWHVIVPRKNRFLEIFKNGLNPYRIAFISLLLLGLVDHYLLTLQQGRILFSLVGALAYNTRLKWFVSQKKS